MAERTLSGDGLVDLVDRLLDVGVVIAGQVTVSLADIDLIDVDLRALLTGVESSRRRAGLPERSTWGRDDTSLPALPPPPSLPQRLDAAGRGEDGIARLVLVLVDLLRRVLESQALSRLESGSLTDHEIERLGRALMLLEHRCQTLRDFLATDDAWQPFPLPDRRTQL